MARPEALIPGNCYFLVHFYDNDLLLPMIDTLVYVGQESDQDEGRLIGFSDRQLHEIVDFDGLMQRLREIAADHPLNPVSQPAAEPATDEEFESVPGEVAGFLNDLDCVCLTMTIRFTDDGLPIGHRDAGYEMGFFPHPRRDPD